MKHGANCDCVVCSLGKKMGMLKKADSDIASCESCGAEKKDQTEDCCKTDNK